MYPIRRQLKPSLENGFMFDRKPHLEKRLLPSLVKTRRIGEVLDVQLPARTETEFEALTVFGINGQIISRVSLQKNQPVQLRLPGLSQGLYWLDLQERNGPGVRKKFSW